MPLQTHKASMYWLLDFWKMHPQHTHYPEPYSSLPVHGMVDELHIHDYFLISLGAATWSGPLYIVLYWRSVYRTPTHVA